MKKLLIIGSLILVLLTCIGIAGGGYWAYQQYIQPMQIYKTSLKKLSTLDYENVDEFEAKISPKGKFAMYINGEYATDINLDQGIVSKVTFVIDVSTKTVKLKRGKEEKEWDEVFTAFTDDIDVWFFDNKIDKYIKYVKTSKDGNDIVYEITTSKDDDTKDIEQVLLKQFTDSFFESANATAGGAMKFDENNVDIDYDGDFTVTIHVDAKEQRVNKIKIEYPDITINVNGPEGNTIKMEGSGLSDVYTFDY